MEEAVGLLVVAASASDDAGAAGLVTGGGATATGGGSESARAHFATPPMPRTVVTASAEPASRSARPRGRSRSAARLAAIRLSIAVRSGRRESTACRSSARTNSSDEDDDDDEDEDEERRVDHRATSHPPNWSGKRRSCSRPTSCLAPRDVWLFTVPTEMPRIAATSLSGRSNAYRSTTHARRR